MRGIEQAITKAVFDRKQPLDKTTTKLPLIHYPLACWPNRAV